MKFLELGRWAEVARRNWWGVVCLTLLSSLLCACSGAKAARPEAPTSAGSAEAALPQDTGAPGLQEMLRRLGTTARLLQTVAHPDDEDGGMLTLESRGRGVTTTLLTLNRGEGGQNKLGSNLFDVLGVLRTLEVTAADRYYGVEQRFTRVADFGFSKTPEETLQKWKGHDVALGDIVRVIRTFRPDVIAARFSGTERDGHGHHQVSSILSREAFHAAADPNRFPDQIKEGLRPWQAKKLYIGNVCGFGAMTCPDADYTIKLNTGVQDSTLGTSYVAFAMKGLKHQLSQGAGAWTVDPGDRFTYYKLVDLVQPGGADKVVHEQDFFDGMDTTLAGLASRLGAEEIRVPFLRPALTKMQGLVATAERDSTNAAGPLFQGLALTRKLETQLKDAELSEAAKNELLMELQTKERQFEEAANLAAGVELTAAADVPVGASAEGAFMAVPGQSFRVKARFTHRIPVDKVKIELDVPSGWKIKELNAESGTSEEKLFEVLVPADAKYTRPYWHRSNPETETINVIDDAEYLTLPFPPAPVKVRATYIALGEEGVVIAQATVKYRGEAGEELERAIAVAPAYSVMLDPGQQVMAVGERISTVTVAVNSNLASPSKGSLHLDVPVGWRVEPSAMSVELPAQGKPASFQFKIFERNLQEGRADIRAVLEAGGAIYREGYSVVTRDDLDTFYYYQPAVQRVSAVEVKVPADLKIGYVMGAGDDIPPVLQQLGMDVTVIAAEKLAMEDLSRYATIVLGIRAYDTQKGVTENNSRLLDFVKAGGTLVVQYDTGVGGFNAGKFAPYPAKLGRERVSVEEAPVTILAPEDRIFHYPNEITGRDFDGWVQERGLYFMNQWDSAFKPLLEAHDPGEEERKGGMLEAHYGKGIYIYTGYAFFRQLPAGVPGAVRLYVNLLSAKGSG